MPASQLWRRLAALSLFVSALAQTLACSTAEDAGSNGATCAVCGVESYGCLQPGMETFGLVTHDASAAGCTFSRDFSPGYSASFNCATGELCAPGGCFKPDTTDGGIRGGGLNCYIARP